LECHALSNKGYAFGTLTTREDAQLDPIWLPRPSEKAREASTRSKPRLLATTVAFMPVSFVPTEFGRRRVRQCNKGVANRTSHTTLTCDALLCGLERLKAHYMVYRAAFALDTESRRHKQGIVAFAGKEVFANGKPARASATHAVVPCVRLWMANGSDRHQEASSLLV